MKIVGFVFFCLIVIGLLALICFEAVSLVKKIKEYRLAKKNKEEKKGE